MNNSRKAAKKRQEAVPIPNRNANKYFSYSEAWVRIKKAHGSGFYLEAVTLEESIIADRLLSFLVCAGEIQAESRVENRSLGQLVQLWKKRVPEPIAATHFPDLHAAVDEWRKRRNLVVHGMVKSMPGAQHGDVLDFLKEAEFVAFQGKALALAVSDWTKKFKRQFDGVKPNPAHESA
jgi:hypothetical protein